MVKLPTGFDLDKGLYQFSIVARKNHINLQLTFIISQFCNSEVQVQYRMAGQVHFLESHRGEIKLSAELHPLGGALEKNLLPSSLRLLANSVPMVAEVRSLFLCWLAVKRGHPFLLESSLESLNMAPTPQNQKDTLNPSHNRNLPDSPFCCISLTPSRESSLLCKGPDGQIGPTWIISLS